jgi:hypothetical protein
LILFSVIMPNYCKNRTDNRKNRTDNGEKALIAANVGVNVLHDVLG